MIHRLIHPKVRWAALAGIAATVLTALAGATGLGLSPVLAAVLTTVATFLAGYRAPVKDEQDEVTPDA